MQQKLLLPTTKGYIYKTSLGLLFSPDINCHILFSMGNGNQ